MCLLTRFPEAIPLRNIKAPKIAKALIKFFTLFGLPKSVQSDQGSNFMSHLFQDVMALLGIKQVKSSAYHHQFQKALERFHQTLKTMMRSYCLQEQKDCDEGIPLLLFAAREAVQESLGFSSFELVFGHTPRGPLKVLKEQWLSDEEPERVLVQISDIRHRLRTANELAQKNLKAAQSGMKLWSSLVIRCLYCYQSMAILCKLVIVDPLPLQRKLMRWTTLSTQLDIGKQDDSVMLICSRVTKRQNKIAVN